MVMPTPTPEINSFMFINLPHERVVNFTCALNDYKKVCERAWESIIKITPSHFGEQQKTMTKRCNDDLMVFRDHQLCDIPTSTFQCCV